MEDYLKVSEIGSLFGLGVQTLHYYDKVGILKPELRDPETGYRKYRFDQIYQLASIRYMRKMGYSIDEIREFQDGRTPEDTIQHLRDRSAVLRKQWEELMRVDEAIMRKIQFIESAMKDLEPDSLRVCDLEDRYYIPIGTEEEIYMDESFYFYPTIAFYEENLKYFGALIDINVDFVPAETTIQRIPAGKYLIGYHVGPYEQIGTAFERMRAAYPEYTFGPLIASFNIIDQFVEQDNEKYITEIQMQITGEKKADF